MRAIVIIFILSTFHVCAQQSKSLQVMRARADQEFRNGLFYNAQEKYQDLVDKNAADTWVYFRLAECYRKTFHYEEAEGYYLKSYYASPAEFPRSLYYNALMLKYNAEIDEAVKRFDEFIAEYDGIDSLKEFTEQALIEKAGCEMTRSEWRGMESIRNNTALMPTPVNSAFNDFAPALRDTTSIVITSGRISSTSTAADARYGGAFTNNYYFEKNISEWKNSSRSNFEATNTGYNDGGGCFNRDGSKYYFSVCGLAVPQCQIFVTAYTDGKWQEPRVLNTNVNLPGFEAKQPAITNGSDTLFFVSDRPGGVGQLDIWFSIDSGNDEWGPPMNAGRAVNTKYNEISPSATPYRNIVFFASDGHQGFGGLDVFMAKRLSNGDTLVTNVGYPVNTSRDDCFLTSHATKLFWSSNRLNGHGGFDIYETKILSLISYISKVSLRTSNDGRQAKLKGRSQRANAINLMASTNEDRIDYHKLSYERKKIVDKMLQSKVDTGDVRREDFPELSDEEFRIYLAMAEELYSQNQVRLRFSKTFIAHVQSPSDTNANIILTGLIVDSLRHTPMAGEKIILTETTGEVLKITTTNESGEFRFTDIPSSRKLIIRLAESPGQDIRVFGKNIAVKSIPLQFTLQVENLFFDFAQYRLRPEATKVLDEIASYLMAHPGVQVELFAFADDRGSDAYNFYLTQRRGQAVGEYLMRKGIDETSVAIIAKGRQVQESPGEIARQFNRRVELYLTGMVDTFTPNVKTYILKKALNWETLARETGVDTQTLKEINNYKSNWVKPFSPVGIPSSDQTLSKDLFYSGI